jgi:hypothetical protein
MNTHVQRILVFLSWLFDAAFQSYDPPNPVAAVAELNFSLVTATTTANSQTEATSEKYPTHGDGSARVTHASSLPMYGLRARVGLDRRNFPEITSAFSVSSVV